MVQDLLILDMNKLLILILLNLFSLITPSFSDVKTDLLKDDFNKDLDYYQINALR